MTNKRAVMRLADRVAAALRERGHKSVIRGDGVLVDACGEFTNIRNDHPLNVMTAALNSCARATDIFDPLLVLAHDCKGRSRVVRGFRLRDAPTHDG